MSEQPIHACLDSETVQGFVEGWLRGATYTRASEHVDRCSQCRALVVEAARSYSGASKEAATVDARPVPQHPGFSSARYEITDVIGAGGMGIVYQAYDVQLQRKVALKVLRSAEGSDALSSHARLLREARAMAQLSDPNVVHVYDVGAFDGQVFIAMELVEGETLGQWLRRSTRTTEEIAAVFIDAGRGLAAAHAVGLVHRDFKPENVLIGRDGRTRVGDFGVARLFDAQTPDDARSSYDILSVNLTEAGAVVGTPAYMSPEQLAGGAVDARADQFSFCVTLYESVYGTRPFAGTTPADLAAAVLAGNVVVPKNNAHPRLLAILRRGLSREPEQRYENMAALLTDLEQIRRVSHRKQRRRLLGAALTLVAALAVAVWVWPRERTVTPAQTTPPPSVEPQPAPVAVAPSVEPSPPPVSKKVLPPRRRHRENRRTASPMHDDALLPFGGK